MLAMRQLTDYDEGAWVEQKVEPFSCCQLSGGMQFFNPLRATHIGGSGAL